MMSLLIFTAGLLVGAFAAVYGRKLWATGDPSSLSKDSQLENSKDKPEFSLSEPPAYSKVFEPGLWADDSDCELVELDEPGSQVFEFDDPDGLVVELGDSVELDDSGSQVFELDDPDGLVVELGDSVELDDPGSQVIQLEDISEVTNGPSSDEESRKAT